MKRKFIHAFVAVALVLPATVAQPAAAQERARANTLGISALIGGTVGPLNAITDVPGVEVGHTTLITGQGPLVVGQGPVRIGRPSMQPWGLPVVAETYDGGLNDINGFHVKPEHVLAALDGAAPGPVIEGNAGGGTGMRCHGFKGGIGTASRRLDSAAGGYTLGVLVQCNYGARRELRIAGVPVGEEIRDLLPCAATPDTSVLRGLARCTESAGRSEGEAPSAADEGSGSIIIVIATDAPLLPHQLKRIATRAALGVGRTGGRGENSSGDIFVAFSTANAGTGADTGIARLSMLPNPRINPLFAATVQATEEAILNAMLAAETMTGANDLRVHALPHDRLLTALRKYGRAPVPP